MNIINVKNAQLFLFFNALFWGSSYIWSKMLLGFLPQFSILFICSVCGLLTTFLLFKNKLKKIDKKAIIISVAISLVSVVSNTFCMLALQRTTGSNTAFIVQLSIVITPLIMAIFDKKLPTLKTVLLALTALIGIYLITCSENGFNVNLGDIFALCNALFFSLFLALQNKASSRVHPIQFTFIQHLTNTVAFLALALIFESSQINMGPLLSPVFLILIVLNSLVVIFTSLFQSSAIKYVRPENATILYAFEPVITTILGIILLGEKLSGIQSIFGCIIVLMAVALSAFNLKSIKAKLVFLSKLTSKNTLSSQHKL